MECDEIIKRWHKYFKEKIENIEDTESLLPDFDERFTEEVENPSYEEIRDYKEIKERESTKTRQYNSRIAKRRRPSAMVQNLSADWSSVGKKKKCPVIGIMESCIKKEMNNTVRLIEELCSGI
jgi:DNA repair exonuclease SbcCD ATPase subunit